MALFCLKTRPGVVVFLQRPSSHANQSRSDFYLEIRLQLSNAPASRPGRELGRFGTGSSAVAKY
jgi:hypothetical protein